MQSIDQDQPRRRSGHSKSTSGCEMCRQKHIKCDELRPECRNCVKRGRHCDYDRSSGPVKEGSNYSPKNVTLIWPPYTNENCQIWQQTGIPPFPVLSLPYHASWHNFSLQDLRYMHHMCTISSSLELSKNRKATLWGSELPRFLRLGCSHEFLAHSLMAMSASHVAWLTKSIEADSVAAKYQILASKGIREALTHFSRENADAILASSIMLSVQVNEWRSFKAVGQGISAVISAMEPWKEKSAFLSDLEAQVTCLLPTVPTNDSQAPLSQISVEVGDLLKDCINSLSALEPLVRDRVELAQVARELLNFTERVQSHSSSLPLPAQYKTVYFLRGWLYRLPSYLVDVTKGDILVLVTLAHFYAVALMVAPIYPVMNQIQFVNIRVAAIFTIEQGVLDALADMWNAEKGRQAATLMAYPLRVASLYQRPEVLTNVRSK